MEEAQWRTSKSSETLIAFPRYRRSHLRSRTYSTLLTILSQCYDYENSKLSRPSQTHTATQELKIHDDGVDKMRRESQERGPEHLKFVGADVVDPSNPIFSSKSNPPYRFEGVGVQARELSDMKMVVDDIELLMGLLDGEGSSRRQDMMIYESGGVMSPEANGLTKEQNLMDELEQIVKGSEKLVCDSGLSPPNVGLVEKQNGSSEIDLMDNQLEGLEFQQSNMNKCGPSGESQVEGGGEFNQHASEGFQSSLSANVSKSSINEQSSLLEIGSFNINHERQQKEMAIVKPAFTATGFPPVSEEDEFEEGEHPCQKVTEIIGISLNQDMINETSNSNESGGDRKLLLDTGSLDAEDEMHHTEEQSRKLSCGNGAATSSSHMIEGGDVEEGEISGDLGMDGNLFSLSSVDISMLPQNIDDEVTRPKFVTEKNILFPCNIQNGEIGYKSTSFARNELQDANDSGEVEPRESERKSLVCGFEVVEPREAIRSEKKGDYGLVPKSGESKDTDSESKEAVNLPAALAYDQVLQRQLSEEEDTGDDGNSSIAKQKSGVNSKKKRGPLTEARKAKRKQQKRKKRAEKNRQLGVKRLKLLPVQKPKPIEYCRHYLKGKCYEGDKCKFSHDTVPLTKSKPCCHFARHSCMKGDDCPFDHQLSKYPCSNFVSKGSCTRGDACLFSHKMPTKEDASPASNECRSDLKPSLLPVNTNSNKLLPVNGSSASLQNHLSDSGAIHPLINMKHEAADVVRKPLTQAPKGISFINVSKSSPPKPSTLEQGMVAVKESLVQVKTHTDKSLSGTAQNLEETPKKMAAVAPKGINFLSFGKGHVSNSKISVSSILNKENVIKLPQLDNFGLLEQSSLSLNKDDYNKVVDMQKQSLLQAVIFSNESLKKRQSTVGGMNSDFPGKPPGDKSATDIQCSLTSYEEHILSKSIQVGVKESDNSQMSTGTSSALPLSPFVLGQSSESLASGHHKYASNSAQKALFSTLAFAAKHELDIKMK